MHVIETWTRTFAMERKIVALKISSSNFENCSKTYTIGLHILRSYTLKTEVLKITIGASFLTLPKSARRDNTRSVTQTPREVSRS